MNAITSLDLVAGGPSKVVQVGDQNGTILPPNTITWPAASELNIVPNATGFTMNALPRGVATSIDLVATYTGQMPNVAQALTINIVLPAVTGLTFFSS
jgi:hypothetical protein